VQSIYEGNVRFEHCYRLDLDLEIVPTHRRHCWEQWLESYRYGQPRDRVEYARRRLRLFASGDFGRPLLHTDSSSVAKPPPATAAPEPTSVRAPPPALAADAATAPSMAVLPALVPGADCSNDCARSHASCQKAPCAEGSAGAAGGPACASCDQDYKGCMRRCFE
jgi:hypothetical protein